MGSNEYNTYSFPNNLHFSVETNATLDLSVLYLPSMANRHITTRIKNQAPLALSFKFRPTIRDFLPDLDSLPVMEGYRAIDAYGSSFELVSNTSVDELTIHVEKNATLGLEPAKKYIIACYIVALNAWQLVDTQEQATTGQGSMILQGSLNALVEDQAYYVTVLELATGEEIPEFWTIITLLLVASVIVLAALISKQDFVQQLKARHASIEPGPHKMTIDDVLENENRNRIIDLVLEEPGIHFNELLRRIDIAPGNLVWHLDVLESYKVIGKRRISNRVVYFPYHAKNPLANLNLQLNKSKLSLDILKLIEDEPGTWANILTKKLEVNRKTIQYHVKKLHELGVIRLERIGKKKKIFVNPDSEYIKSSKGSAATTTTTTTTDDAPDADDGRME